MSSWFSALSGVCQDLAAAWFGLILVAPGLAVFERSDFFLLLIRSLVFGILFLYLSVEFENLS